MIYVTVKQHRKPKQLKWEDVLYETVSPNQLNTESDSSATVTRQMESVPYDVLRKVDVSQMIYAFKRFNEDNEALFAKERSSMYTTFQIPKSSGGFRRIDAPCEELKHAMSRLSAILTDTCGVLYHTSAYAYIPGRCVQDVAKKHVKAKSQWYLKTDLSGFFPSTTLDFAMKMLSMVFPLSEVIKDKIGEQELRKALSLGFLNGSLPQGSPLSPTLTNMIFIPIDFKLANEFAKRKLVYTRYADDTHISAEERFPYKNIIRFMTETFREFDAPYTIKAEKTHFGSYKGQNWMLGMMLNGNYDITVGYRAKKYFKAALCSFILDTKNKKYWELGDVQHLQGQLNWYTQVEPDYFKMVINKANLKWGVDVRTMMKAYISGKI